MLIDKLITDIEWLLVYKVTQVKAEFKLKHVRPELYEDWMRLH